ncbi:MAG: heparinase II/III family protein [Enterocloster sp.]
MPEGDPEFIYQFNRHRYWICLGQAYALTGDGKYAECFVEPAVFLAGGQSHKPGDKEHYLEDHRGRYPGRKLGKGHGIF